VIVLDTNVLSELMRPSPHQRVVSWLDAQDPEAVATTSITVAEILYGVGRLSDGKRKEALGHVAVEIFEEELAGRVFLLISMRRGTTRPWPVPRTRRPPVFHGRRPDRSHLPVSRRQARHAQREDFEVLEIETVNPWEADE
jgi:toxin FitB